VADDVFLIYNLLLISVLVMACLVYNLLLISVLVMACLVYNLLFISVLVMTFLVYDLLFIFGLAYQEGKDIVFRFIIEYSSLRDFGPPR
jgi:hypothetical protein